MRYQILDQTGHTEELHDTKVEDGIARAERRFKELTGQGFRAAKITDDGSPGTMLKQFDPTAESVVFIPRLVGG